MSQKILIVSDSHGRDKNLQQAIQNMGSYLDRMIHLGDSQHDPERLTGMVDCPVEMVRGNCDGLSRLPGTKLVDLGPHKAMITHGHLYGGSVGIPQMKSMARENGADIVMFGHTHIPMLEQEDGMTVLNPGSISQPRQDGRRPTYMVMTIEDDGRTDYATIYL